LPTRLAAALALHRALGTSPRQQLELLQPAQEIRCYEWLGHDLWIINRHAVGVFR